MNPTIVANEVDASAPGVDFLLGEDASEYGFLPLVDLDQLQTDARQDMAKFPGFEDHYEAFLLFRWKFKTGLDSLLEKTLSLYPERDEQGSIVSLYGLCGSGKSLLVSALKKSEKLQKAIFIDTDAVRFSVFAPLVRDLEISNGTSFDSIRSEKIYDRGTSKMRKAFMEICSEILRNRGYRVIHTATWPIESADAQFYVEHPRVSDLFGLGPILEALYEQTENRTSGVVDNFDWDQALPILDFRSMPPVTVRVTLTDHARILERLRSDYTPTEANTLRNPFDHDSRRAQQDLLKAFFDKYNI